MYSPTSVKHLRFTTLVLAKVFERRSRFIAFLFLLMPYVPSQAANWIQSTEHAGIAYFLYQSPAVIERYDLANQAFLPNILLSDIPTAFSVDHDGIYISFGRRTSRFALNGTGEVHLQNTDEDVTDLLVNGDFLYLFHRVGNLLSVNKFTGVLLDWKDYFYGMQGPSIAPTVGKIFARSTGISPADIMEVVTNADGTLGIQADSPYHGDYPSASMTYVFPGDARVADNSGIVYSTSDLTYNNSLAGSFDNMDFYGDLPIVLRGDTLYSYSNTFLETGNHTASRVMDKIYVHGDTIFAFFTNDLQALDLELIPVSLLTPDVPGTPVDPNGLAYTPDSIVLGSGGRVFLLSNANLSVFRWSSTQRRYLDSIPLVETVKYMAFSAETNTLYLAYDSGKITQINLAVSDTEVPFVNSPQSPNGLATAGEFVFVVDPSGAWVSHFTYDPTGVLLSQEEWNYFSNEYIWNAANRKMYFFRDDTSPNDLLWEDIDINGFIGANMDSPYHSSEGIVHPIRVEPDGSTVLLGSGRIYDAISLERIDTLSNNINDAAWVGSTLFTLIAGVNGSEIQEWDVNYAIVDSIPVVGEPLRIFGGGADLLIITSVDGIPRFYILSAAAPRVDTDSDTILNPLDNCILESNTDQRDSNADGYGSICDADLDNSGGVVNFADLAAFKTAFGTTDPDADFDGNGGVVNFGDLAIFRQLFGQPPGPSCCAP
jgi:hypothetical protein